jgi:hypothetical protein
VTDEKKNSVVKHDETHVKHSGPKLAFLKMVASSGEGRNPKKDP